MMDHHCRRQRRPINVNGFTLIELMMAVAVMSVLALIALPAYKSHVQTAKRADATRTLLGYANKQELYFSQYKTYNTDLTELDLSATSPEGHYNVTVGDCDNDASTSNINSCFLLTATAIGPQLDDTRCRTFTLGQNGVRRAQDSDGGDTTERCW